MRNPWKSKSKVNPQAENGHRRIANEVLQQLIKQGLTGSEWDVVMTVIDKTYGFGKLSDRISYGQIVNATSLSRRTAIRAVNSLEARRILVVSRMSPVNQILFNKHHDTWQLVTQMSPAASDTDDTRLVTQMSPELVTRMSPTKERKKTLNICSFDRFWKIWPKKVAKQAALKAWEKLKPDEDLFQTIATAIEGQIKTRQWQTGNGQFIPYPASWLNGRRWEDEAEKVDDWRDDLPEL
jgi:phage replication O-like protein O